MQLKVIFTSLLLIPALCGSLSMTGQVKFEKGYYIDNENVRNECLIKNKDWAYNPVSFEYKIHEQDKAIMKNISSVKEFGILNSSKYVRAKLNIDRSSDLLDDIEMSNKKAPEWKEEELFLKVLVEGEAILYMYEETNFIRFFYKVKDNGPSQLIYKKYRQPGEIDFQYNREYINQLNTYVNCNNVSITEIEKVSYSQSALKSYFKKYNSCAGGGAISTFSFETKKRKWFYLKPLLGVNYSSYTSGSSLDATLANITFGSKAGFTAGFEAEFILPFEKNAWSGLVEGSTFSFKSSGKNSQGNTAQVDYNSIIIGLGLRYNLFLTDNSKVFFNILEMKDIKVTQLSLTPAIGAGYAYKKLSAELRVSLRKNIDDYYYYATTHPSFKNGSFIIKYVIY